MGWFSKKEKSPTYEIKFEMPSPAKKGFQVGDRVIVVRFPNDPHWTVSDFEDVYGRIGEIAEVIRTREDSMYDYTVKFPDWNGGWDTEDRTKEGPHWGVYHKNLRRVVSKKEFLKSKIPSDKR